MNSQSLDSKRDNYHIVSLIGQGAYGQVFKARRKGTGQFVAIKTIKKKYVLVEVGTNRKKISSAWGRK